MFGIIGETLCHEYLLKLYIPVDSVLIWNGKMTIVVLTMQEVQYAQSGENIFLITKILIYQSGVHFLLKMNNK